MPEEKVVALSNGKNHCSKERDLSAWATPIHTAGADLLSPDLQTVSAPVHYTSRRWSWRAQVIPFVSFSEPRHWPLQAASAPRKLRRFTDQKNALLRRRQSAWYETSFSENDRS